MAGKRIYDTDPSKSLSPLSGAGSANDDKFVVFDTSEGVTKRMDRSQVAIGLVGDLPYTPSGGISATTIPTAIAELDSEAAKSAALAASGGAALVGFSQSGTGAVTRTVQAKLRDFVNAKDFTGVDPTGVDISTTGLQNALNFAASTTKKLFIPAGTYLINAALNVASGMTIEAEGFATIKLADNCTPKPGSMLACNGSAASRRSNVKISGLTIDGNYLNNIDHGAPDVNGNQPKAYEGTMLAAVSLAFIDNVEFSNNIVKNVWGSGVWMVDCTNERVINNTIIDGRMTGISIRRVVPLETPGNKNFYIAGNYVRQFLIGIHAGIFGTHTGTVIGNRVEDCLETVPYPSWAYSGTYPNVWPSTGGFKEFGQPGYVSPVNQGDGAGIELTGFHTVPGAAKERFVTITGNAFNNNIFGVRLEQEANNIAVAGNVFNQHARAAIYLYSVSYITVSGNAISSSVQNGISIERAPSQARPAALIITGNSISDCGWYGVSASGAKDLNITGNGFFNNGTDTGRADRGVLGLFESSSGPTICQNVTFTANTAVQNGGVWLYYGGTSPANVKVTDNQFTGVPTTKMTGVTAANTQLWGNTGLVTRASGSVSVASNSFATVTHGLDITPSVANIRITPVQDIASDGRIYVNPVPTSTTFDVIYSGGSGTKTFGWSIDDR